MVSNERSKDAKSELSGSVPKWKTVRCVLPGGLD